MDDILRARSLSFVEEKWSNGVHFMDRPLKSMNNRGSPQNSTTDRFYVQGNQLKARRYEKRQVEDLWRQIDEIIKVGASGNRFYDPVTKQSLSTLRAKLHSQTAHQWHILVASSVVIGCRHNPANLYRKVLIKISEAKTLPLISRT